MKKMGKVTTAFSMSLDGFIALPNNEIGPLFDWFTVGGADIELPSGGDSFKVSSETATMIQEAGQATGALLVGRTLFDFTNAWGGRHPMDVPVVVVTHSTEGVAPEWLHEDSVFTFVTDGIESAMAKAQEIAGEKNVTIASANVLQQCIRAGWLDEIHIDLVPVLLGEGIRMFDHLRPTQINLESTSATSSAGVLHLTYRIVK
jgi:dihydrofolate reductase